MTRALMLPLLLFAACKGKDAAPRGAPTAAPVQPAPLPVAIDGAAAPTAAPDAAAVAPATTGDDLGSGADGRPLYYPRALTAADLDGRTLRDLALMRNVVFARAGHTFRKAWLRDFFTAQPWYQPRAQDDDSKISATDRANAKLIAAREAAFSRDQLVARQGVLTAAAAPTPAELVELRLINEQLGSTPATATTGRSPLEDPAQLDRLLTLDQLADLSRRDLRILRNTVYARHGRPFKSEVLQQWFAAKDWYQVAPAFTEAMLTAIDKKNVKMIRSVEDTLGGAMSEHEQQAEDGWFEAA